MTAQEEQAALTAGEIAAINDPDAPGAAGRLITALARQFDIEPTDVGLALRQARTATETRRKAQAPPPPVTAYYRLSWSEREISGYSLILTAAELADIAGPDLDDDTPATANARLMNRIVERPHEYALDDRVTDLDRLDYRDREITDLERFDFEVQPLTVLEAFDEGHALYPLYCYYCDARVERRGPRYVHAESGTFELRGFSDRASAEDKQALLAAHAEGTVCPDGYITEAANSPVPQDHVAQLAAQWGETPATPE